MSEAFAQAWSLLKAVFQPIESDYRLGAGQNQVVFGQEGNPDVTKVGGLDGTTTVSDMYLLNTLAQMYPDLLVGQRPIVQTEELPSDLQTDPKLQLPILSTQERGVPFGAGGYEDVIRGRHLTQALYGAGDTGKLFENLGMTDLKPPNWIKHPRGKLPHYFITGQDPVVGTEGALIMDPMFMAPDDTSQIARLARGSPYKPPPVPAETLERFARQIDREPYEQFIEPVLQSYEEFNPELLESTIDPISRGQRNVDRITQLMGI